MNEPEDIRSHLIGKSKEEAETEPRPFYFSIDITYGLTVAWVCSSNGTVIIKRGKNRKAIF
jgi:hypothetical protein